MNQNELLALLKPETEKIDQAMRQDLSGVGNQRLRQVLEYAIFNGGKRVRPLLTVLAARLCWQRRGEELTPEVSVALYRLALAFEYLHAASLLHDDVIDRADSRRGRQTANRVWDNTHVILAGDYLHARAMRLAGGIGGELCLDAIGSATAAMVEAEFLQLDNAASIDLSPSRYFAVLDGKTAALIAAAASTGAHFAKASGQEVQALRTFGKNLGLTFQIVDDLLDYLGDSQKTGKAVGNDFQEGKMTLPLLLALDQANPADRATLMGLLRGTAQERADHFQKALGIIQQAGGFTAARDKAEALVAEAIKALDIFTRSQELEVLASLARYVLHREG